MTFFNSGTKILRRLSDQAAESTEEAAVEVEEHFGVHIEFPDLYAAIVFLGAIYASGIAISRFLGMPSLVGEIFIGILMGPNMFDVVPNEEAFVLLGEIGLVLLVLEAGIDIDLTTLRLVGTRGTLIAFAGTILPVGLAIAIAHILGFSGTTAIAAGCVFCPTSLGIAMNVLRRSGVINTPTGQLIVAAAIIDDMVALVILSQLQAFTNPTATALDMIIPVASALGFLLIGGAMAIFLLPKFLNEYILDPIEKSGRGNREWTSLAIMFALLLILVPITYDAKASPLMGAFLAGLVFCSDSGAHHMFVSQFKRVMQWLMRIFFAASIGFQVPFHKFGDPSVILHGLFFTVALLGKVAVGFMVPNFQANKRFKGTHLRDCLIVGFSMSAEGEFAFVIAVFAVSHEMIPQELYASVVLAVLFSTIIGPFCLQKTITYYNKKIESEVFGSGQNETDPSSLLEKSIRENTALFFCIQTKSAPAWGLQTGIVEELTKLNLDIIDHRSWHSKQSDNILVNEIYAKDDSLDVVSITAEEVENRLSERIADITQQLTQAINQTTAIIRVQRWVPEISPEFEGDNVAEHIVRATGHALKASMEEHAQVAATPAKEDAKPRSYRRMEDANVGGNRQLDRSYSNRPALGYRVIQIGHIDDLFTGRLEGLFRHDFDSLLLRSPTGGEGHHRAPSGSNLHRRVPSHMSRFSMDEDERSYCNDHEQRDLHGVGTGMVESSVLHDIHGVHRGTIE